MPTNTGLHMLPPLLAKLFSRLRTPKQTAPVTNDEVELVRPRVDPLDVASRGWHENEQPPIHLRDVSEFPLYEASDTAVVNMKDTAFVGDAALVKSVAMDDGQGAPVMSMAGQSVAPDLQNWYMSHGFIGYQACALIAQHWLVDKACSMAGEDAARNGWVIKSADEENELSDEDHAKLTAGDVPYKLKFNLAELNRFKNVFGIRVVLFEVDSDDPDYYTKPFNIDGVTKGSYKGISQVDPYWMTPMLTTQSTSDPSAQNFYEPEYWIISGKRYHRSHLCVIRGPQPADILKPTYIFGGVPLTQRIYERVYAAERTANEAPLLAMNKRTTALHVDLTKLAANEAGFTQRLMKWVRWRDNHAVKVLGTEETMEQFDTSLADFDSVIMNQYQLVAAIAKTPATKLLGTSPKGFNATGEFETVSYHEELESIQEHVYHPVLDRHYLLLSRSLGIECELNVVFNPVDSVTSQQRAELNEKKAQTGAALITAGVISPDEERQRLREDKNSGYNRLTDEDAETTPGMSPENIADLEKGAGEQATGQGAEERGQAALGAQPETPDAGHSEEEDERSGEEIAANPNVQPALSNPQVQAMLRQTLEMLSKLSDEYVPEGSAHIEQGQGINFARSTKPSTQGSVNPSVAGIRSVSPSMGKFSLPKMKIQGMVVCVENPRGTIRKGMDISGKQWACKMPHHYGFINHTTGADGEEMDCFVGHNMDAPNAYVINQNDPSTGKFDEHKVMLGFNTPEEAKQAYLASYSTGWNGLGEITPVPIAQFKDWLLGGNHEAPLSAANLAQAGQQPETR